MYYIGIDLGGTNIKAGIVSSDGAILLKKSIKTRAERSQEDITRDMGLLAVDLLQEAAIELGSVAAIGVGSPGTPDNVAGVLIYANNLPFNHLPLRRKIREVIDLPVYIDNDANVAALAESVAGAAKGTRHSVTITLGTGVGGGVVVNSRIYSGFNNAGCEIGHIVQVAGGEPCTCGRKGCFEAYASATAIIRETERAAALHPESVLTGLIAENGGKANGRTPFIAMRQGDAAGRAVVEGYIEMLAEGLANVINAYMPEVLVIGGGVCNEGDPLIVPVREKALARAYLGEGVPVPQIRVAEMGNDAGIIGAAMMGMNCLQDGLSG